MAVYSAWDPYYQLWFACVLLAVLFVLTLLGGLWLLAFIRIMSEAACTLIRGRPEPGEVPTVSKIPFDPAAAGALLLQLTKNEMVQQGVDTVALANRLRYEAEKLHDKRNGASTEVKECLPST